MDKSQVMTIVITAVISVIAKEVVMWAVALVRKTAASATIKAKLRAIFNKTNLFVLGDIVFLAMYIYMFFKVGWTDDPMTGKKVVELLFWLFFAIVFSVRVLWGIAKAIVDRERRPDS